MIIHVFIPDVFQVIHYGYSVPVDNLTYFVLKHGDIHTNAITFISFTQVGNCVDIWRHYCENVVIKVIFLVLSLLMAGHLLLVDVDTGMAGNSSPSGSPSSCSADTSSSSSCAL